MRRGKQGESTARGNRYEQRPLTQQELNDFHTAHARREATLAIWERWLDGRIIGTPQEREAARQVASHALQAEIAVLERIKAARLRTPHKPAARAHARERDDG